MVLYLSTSEYLASAKTYEAKIAALEKVIAALFVTLERAATNDDLTSYMLDDGQTKVETMYKSAEQVVNSIKALETLLNMYRRKIGGGGVMRFVDSKNLNGSRFGRDN